MDVVLRDRGMIARNTGLIPDGCNISAEHMNPNVWLRDEGHTYLLKDGKSDEVESELLASRLVRCFAVDQVPYERMDYQGRSVSRCELITSKEKSIVFVGDMIAYFSKEKTNPWKLAYENDPYGFYMMNIINYLTGNTDRHWRNWGFWVDNESNTPLKLFPLMDFNRSFCSYNSIEGSQCYTYNEEIPQKTAAIQGVKAIGLNQIHALPENLPDLFADMNSLRETSLDRMFLQRLDVLKRCQNL